MNHFKNEGYETATSCCSAENLQNEKLKKIEISIHKWLS